MASISLRLHRFESSDLAHAARVATTCAKLGDDGLKANRYLDLDIDLILCITITVFQPLDNQLLRFETHLL